MLPTTTQIVRTALAADPSLSVSERTHLLKLLRGQRETHVPAAPESPRILRRRQVAERLGRSLRSVDLLSKQRILHKVKLPGRTRAAGFMSTEIDRLLAEVVK